MLIKKKANLFICQTFVSACGPHTNEQLGNKTALGRGSPHVFRLLYSAWNVGEGQKFSLTVHSNMACTNRNSGSSVSTGRFRIWTVWNVQALRGRQ